MSESTEQRIRRETKLREERARHRRKMADLRLKHQTQVRNEKIRHRKACDRIRES